MGRAPASAKASLSEGATLPHDHDRHPCDRDHRDCDERARRELGIETGVTTAPMGGGDD